MATAHCHTGGGLNSSSGGELELYLKGKRNTSDTLPDNPLSFLYHMCTTMYDWF